MIPKVLSSTTHEVLMITSFLYRSFDPLAWNLSDLSQGNWIIIIEVEAITIWFLRNWFIADDSIGVFFRRFSFLRVSFVQTRVTNTLIGNRLLELVLLWLEALLFTKSVA